MSSNHRKRTDALFSKKMELLELKLKQKGIGAPSRETIPRREESGPCQLSFAQQRLWLLNQMEPNVPVYNIPIALRLHGLLDRVALERSLEKIVQRHESLRTCFQLQGNEPVQVIAASLHLALPLIDLSALRQEQQEQQLSQHSQWEAQQPFDLAQGPLLRVWLLRLSQQEHAFLLTLHHIISDAWSRGILVNEISSLYNASVTGEPSSLAPLPIQYADFAHWQRQWLQGEVLDQQLAYWRAQLEGLTPLELPRDHPRPAYPSYRGAHQWCFLPAELRDGLKALSQREGTTLFMTLLAAFQLLLARYSGQSDIAVGTSIANRGQPEIEGLIGFFVNTLVLRTDLSGNPRFREYLERVRQVCLGAYAHQDLPFEKLVEVLQPERNLNHSPLFQTMLTYQSASPASHKLHELTVTMLSQESTTTKFDLTLFISESSRGLQCVWEYQSDLFKAHTIEQLVDSWRQLLEAIVAHPDQRLTDLPLLSPRERQRLLVLGQGEERHEPCPSLVELFETYASWQPEQPALVEQGRSWSYQQLNEQANQLAHFLHKQGVSAERLVGVYLPRGARAVLTLLAVLKAGAAYVPLESELPPARLSQLLQQLQGGVLLSERALLSNITSWPGVCYCLDELEAELSQQPKANLRVAIEPEHLAYVLYTSGSTGQPKGVLVRHEGVANYALAVSQQLSARPGWRWATVSTLAADLGNTAIFGAWASGGTVHVISSELLTSPEKLAAHFAQNPVDVLKIVPSHLAALLANSDPGQAKLLLPEHRLVLGGEALPVSLLAELAVLPCRCEIYNHYGPTETTIGVLLKALGSAGSAQELAATSVTLGHPLTNTRVYVLDRQGQLLPAGVTGELYIGGAGLSRGYLLQPAQTAERFVPDPWSKTAGQRLYRTGDRVRWTQEGELEFVGRVDSQVKLRGYRIELGEIEEALRQHPAVREAVVQLVEGEPDKQLVAYVVAGASALEDTNYSTHLRAFLEERLPGYMVPMTYVPLESLPLTANGKIDRRQLPSPDQQHSSDSQQEKQESENESPTLSLRTTIEEIVREIFRTVLKKDQVGHEENFFHLGGHSLLAIQVVAQLRSIFQIELSISALFEAPTVDALAAEVEQELRSEHAMEIPPLVAAPRAQGLPLSFAQQRLWFLDQLEPGLPTYNIPLAVRLRGPLVVGAFEQSLQHLLTRQQSLRTRFQLQGNEPVQLIEPVGVVRVSVLDVSALPQEQQELQGRLLARTEAQQPFDLALGPLLRTHIVRLSQQEHILLLTLHHIISDGWSRAILIRELSTLYNAQVAGEPCPLPDLPIQYADFAYWQRQWLQGEALEAQLAYWRDRLQALPPLELPTDYPRPARPSYRGAHQRHYLPAELRDGLKALSQREGVTLFMTLLAAFQVLLARYSGQSDIAVGSPIANRSRAEVEGLIGFFVNTLVLRTDLSANPSFQELLKRVRETCLGAYVHQDVPFEKLVEVLQPERDLSRSPLFQVMFMLEHEASSRTTLQGLTLSSIFQEGTTTKFDLTIAVTDAAQGLYCEMEYSTDLFAAETITRMLEHWHILLEGIVTSPEQRVSTLPLLTSTEQQLLLEWNKTEDVHPSNALVHRLIEAQAEQVPDAIALSCQGQLLSYDKLNRDANRLAHFLCQQGVGPEILVAVLAERSIPFLTAMLAIFKAGGVYLPLDPLHPSERLQQVLLQSQCRFVITIEPLVTLLAQTLASLPQEEHPSIWQLETLLGQEGEMQESINLPDHAVLSNLAYVIYTSGSTGKPKGVMVNHAGMLNHIYAKSVDVQLAAADVLAQNGPQCFDISLWQSFAPLMLGGRVHIVTDAIAFDPPRLLLQLEEEAISALQLVPALLRALVDELENQPASHRPSLSALRWLIPTGDALPATACRHWLQLYPHIPLLNTYGSTECSDDQCHFPITASLAEEYWLPIMPIGKPIANMSAYILDNMLSPVPIGVLGELYIGGLGVGRGYVGDPERTAQAFIPDPFARTAGQRLYRTGDLARYRSDGTHEFVGRRDHLIKLRGYRIELSEIEAVLATHPGVREAVVILHAGSPSSHPRLLAYLVAQEQDHLPDSVELRAHLAQQLPDYMIPSAFVILPSLPLSPNGKLDRSALPIPSTLPQSSSRPASALSGGSDHPLSELVAGVWSQVLGHDELAPDDHFFELGGHSLLATQVIARLRRLLGVDLPLRTLFEAPTLSAFTQRLQLSLHTRAALSLPPLKALPRPTTLPLSFAQQRLWFLDQLYPGSAAYIIPYAVRMQGYLDLAALQHSLNALLMRHESLRTSFGMQGEVPVQIIAPSAEVVLPLIDLQALPQSAQERETRVLEQQVSHQPFDLSRGPLLRTCLLRLSEEEHVFLLSLHHIISDGWSLGVLVNDLSAFYAAVRAGEPDPLPPLPIQYADYALWQRQWLQGEVLDQQLAYWKQLLRGLSSLSLPLDIPRPPRQSGRGASHHFPLSPELSAQLQALSQQEGVTLFMTLLAAFQLLLARLSGQDDIAVGTDIANRTHLELEPLIGFFVNLLVLRSDLSGSPNFLEVLSQVRERVLSAYSHQDLPFELLVEALGIRQSTDRMPLVQVLLVMQNVPPPQSGLSGLQMSSVRSGTTTARFDLALFMRQQGQSLWGNVVYNRDLFQESTIVTWMQRFERLLQLVVADPHRPVATLELYTEAEKAQQLKRIGSSRNKLKIVKGEEIDLE